MVSAGYHKGETKRYPRDTMAQRSVTKTGWVLGLWPDPLPTGLDLYLVRQAFGISQRAMAFELCKRRSKIIEWERAGATITIPDRLVAWRVTDLWVEAIQDGLMPAPVKSPRSRNSVMASYVKVSGNGDKDWA